MVARENVGLVMKSLVYMMDSSTLKLDVNFAKKLPPYPRNGYIAEHGGIIYINLGQDNSWPAFKYKDFESPNEKLLMKKLNRDGLHRAIFSHTEWLRSLARRYPRAVTF